MSQPRASLLQGTLDLLILKALSAGELHGLGVSRRIEQITGGTFVVQPGSLFPALHRLEESGWLKAMWEASENNRRAKYYTLTKAGKRQLGEATEQWNRVALAMTKAPRRAPNEPRMCNLILPIPLSPTFRLRRLRRADCEDAV